MNLQTQLNKACQDGNLKEVKYLISKGTDIHADNDVVLRRAAYYGHLEIVKYLISKGADIHADNDWALNWAACNGHLEVVKYLISKGADIHAYNDIALRWAAYHGHLEVILYLKRIYLERYGDRFLCHNCIVLPACTTLCSNELASEMEKRGTKHKPP